MSEERLHKPGQKSCEAVFSSAVPASRRDVTHLKVKLGLCEVLVQSRRQVLRRGQDDAAHTNSCWWLDERAACVSDENI